MDIEMVWKFLVTASIILNAWNIFKVCKKVKKLEEK